MPFDPIPSLSLLSRPPLVPVWHTHALVPCSQVGSISGVSVWGEDAVDLSSATLGGKWALDVVGDWMPDASPPDADVAADAIVSHMKDWALGRYAAALPRPRRLRLDSHSHTLEVLTSRYR